MIYTVIARTDILSKYYEKKWDCSSEQPLNLITNQPYKDEFDISFDVKKLISDTKNEKTKKERMSAYTSLFFSLYNFFGLRPSEILRTEYSKPYIREKVSFSISHAGELTAVSLSSDTEVGVDIQERISERIGERVDKRFLNGFEFSLGDINISYLYLTVDCNGNLELIPLKDFENEFFEIEDVRFCYGLPEKLLQSSDLRCTERWTVAEAILKLYGRGFGDLNKLTKNTKQVVCSVNSILFGEKIYLITTAIVKSPLCKQLLT